MADLKERQQKIMKIDSTYLKSVLPPPKSVKIELSGRCNYRCSFCSLTIRDEQPTQDMDFEFFKRITKEMSDLGVKEIGVFLIGESFMNPTLLVDAITYLKKELNFPYVFLTSNASLAKPEVVKKVMEAGLDSLKWSCNTYNEKQYTEMLGVPKSLMPVTTRNIQEAFRIREEFGYNTKLYASSIQYDDDQKQLMEDYLEENIIPFVDLHYWLPLYSSGGQKDGRAGHNTTPGNTGRVDDPVDPLPCWQTFTEGHVLVDGRMSACSFDSSGKWAMGDLNKQSFMEAWNSPKFVELREHHLRKNVKGTICEKCVLYSQ